MSEIAVESRGLGRKYGRTWVLRDLDFKLAAGKFHVLIGRNGSGKSTLLRLLAGMESPSAGESFVFGESVGASSGAFRKRTYWVSEDWAPAHDLGVGAFARSVGPAYPKWRGEDFFSWLETGRISERAKFNSLSRGQRMQVACGFALATHPRLLVLDEVSAVLDSRLRAYLMQKLEAEVDAGGTVVFATNIVSECEGVADSVIAIAEGKMWMQSEIELLHTQFSCFRAESGSSPIAESIAGALEVTPPGARQRVWIRKAEGGRREGEEPKIEEIFQYLTRVSSESGRGEP
ncbi:MAG: ATP-binding cassette domain-containing protein [Bdellovibrionales bacterium]|nr:ATP-binding cassette domain-containing protein [Bdellovibrionales bacterium]